MLLIKVPTLEELKEMQAKILFSRTDLVTKVSDGSVMNALMFASSKTGQKGLKDIALVQSHFFPKTTYGGHLDNVASELFGVAPRFGASGSTTYLRVHATAGTTYTAGVQTVTGTHGLIFDLLETVTVTNVGFAYIKIGSQLTGAITNIDPLSLSKMTAEPVGHDYMINDFIALGGRDAEDDATFRQRIMNSLNIAATSTIKKLELIFMSVNPNVLRVYNQGTDGLGRTALIVASQNGAAFSPAELAAMSAEAERFLSMADQGYNGLGFLGITLGNVTWTPIDISMRLRFRSGYNPDVVRKNMMVRMSRYLDYRVWEVGQRVEWDELLFIAKQTEGVDYILDVYFVPSMDMMIPLNTLPRIRDFEIRDLQGTIITDALGTLNPFYFPQSLDFNYIQTILADL